MAELTRDVWRPLRDVVVCVALLVGGVGIGWAAHENRENAPRDTYGTRAMRQELFPCNEDEVLMFVPWDREWVHCVHVEDVTVR